MGKVRASHSNCLMYKESDFKSQNKYFFGTYICLDRIKMVGFGEGGALV